MTQGIEDRNNAHRAQGNNKKKPHAGEKGNHTGKDRRGRWAVLHNLPKSLLGSFNSCWKILLLLLILATATILLYWPVTGFPFVAYDDGFYITGNQQVTDGLSWHGFRWAFSTFTQGNWHPLTWLSHQADVSLYGLAPGGHHLTNLLLHVVNLLLLFLLLYQLTGNHLRSVAVAAFFAIHPLHVESVVWVSERKDLLCACFFLLTLIFYSRYCQHPSRTIKIYTLLLFACALMAKPMAVTLPLLLLLLDWWPLQRFRILPLRILLLEKMPFIFLAMISAIVTIIAQHSGGAIASFDDFSLRLRVVNAFTAIWRYLLHTLWPEGLAVFYPFPEFLPGWQLYASFCVMNLLLALLIRYRERVPYLLFGYVWFLIMLLPVCGIVQVGLQSMADRYTYLPLIGIFISVVWGVADLSGRYRQLQRAGTLTVCVLLAILTRRQIFTWQDSETLFRHAVNVTDHNYVMHHNLGDEYLNQNKLSEAVLEHAKAVEIHPKDPTSRLIYGAVLFFAGRFEESVTQYRIAIRLKPEYVEAHCNLGASLENLGRIEEAVKEYRHALRIDPQYTLASENLELLLNRK